MYIIIPSTIPVGHSLILYLGSLILIDYISDYTEIDWSLSNLKIRNLHLQNAYNML